MEKPLCIPRRVTIPRWISRTVAKKHDGEEELKKQVSFRLAKPTAYPKALLKDQLVPEDSSFTRSAPPTSAPTSATTTAGEYHEDTITQFVTWLEKHAQLTESTEEYIRI